MLNLSSLGEVGAARGVRLRGGRTPRPERLIARPEVSAAPLDDETVLYDRRSGQTYVLNATGAYVWRLCDGARTVELVARSVAVRFNLDERRALVDVRDLIDDLVRADLLG